MKNYSTIVSFLVGALVMFGVMTFIDNEQSKRYKEDIKKVQQERKKAVHERDSIKEAIKKLEKSFSIEEKKEIVENTLDKIKSNDKKEMVHNDVYSATESALDSTIRAYKYPYRD